jgi:hypothetical protein
LAVVNQGSATVTILTGRGDGSFVAVAPFATPTTTSTPAYIIASDLNNDGIADLFIANQSTGSNVFLGKGDGTFTSISSSVDAGALTSINAVAAADLNNDGIVDLVSTGGNIVNIYFGKGDGTFLSPALEVTVPTEFANSVYAADFDGDGNPDLAVVSDAGMLGESLAILPGNGQGGYGKSILIPAIGRDGNTVAVGDFNGDGFPDIVSPALDGSLNRQVLTLLTTTQSATATIDSAGTPAGTGVSQVVASYAGDSNYRASLSSAVSLTAEKGTPTVAVSASPNPATTGTPLTLTAMVTGSGLMPTGTVIFNDGIKQLGPGTLNSNGAATFSSSSLAVGTHSITASYGGDTNYNSATSSASSLSIIPVGTTTSSVTVAPSATTITDQQSVTVTISVAGGQSAPTGVITVSSGSYSAQQPISNGSTTFTIAAGNLASGTNTLTATYSGDAVYAGSTATATVTVSPVAISLTTPTPVSPGTSTTSSVALAAGSTYTGTMKLTCSLTASPTGAQSVPTCNLNPATVTFTPSGTGNSVLTVNTTTGTSKASLQSLQNGWVFGGGGALAGLLILGIPARRRRWMSWMAMAVLMFMVISAGIIGCGGDHSSTSTPPSTPSTPTVTATTAGNYTFTVTATDSQNSLITTSSNIAVTVQ